MRSIRQPPGHSGHAIRSRSVEREPLLVSGLLFAFLGTAWLIGVGLVDDAYIFLRYARNIHDGLGPVFNAGERVEGYTSPLWLALQVPTFWLARDPSGIIMIVGGLLGLASIILVWARGSLVGAVFLATHPAFVFWSFSGMETPLVSLLLLATFVLLVSNSESAWRLPAAGGLFALAALTRLDSLWLTPILAVMVARQSPSPRSDRARDLTLVFAPLALVAAHAVWRFSYYAAWLPNTYYAKVSGRFSLEPGADYVLRVLILLAVGLLAVLPSRTSPRRTWLPAIAVWWLGLVLLVGGDHFPYGRFVIPLLPLVAAAIGLEHTLDKSMQAQWPTQVILAMLLVASNYALLALPDLDRARKEVYLARAWKSVGEWLSTNLPQDAVVALTAVGSLPYYAERDTVDMLGLTDRHIAVRGGFFSEGHPGHQRYDSTYVLEREPMIIVLPWSGRYTKAAFMEHEWPRFADEDLPYVFALADLLSLSETRRRYQYRATLLPNGTYLDALWRRDVVSGFESHRPRIANQLQ